MSDSSLTPAERRTQQVYGDTFARYDDASFEAFLHPLLHRLETNGIPLSVFQGKRCLDAGCGGGRGTVLMARAGAAEVVAADLSPKNIATTTDRARDAGLSNVTFRETSLLALPFEDASFDVVWCNGVVHHTADPARALVEICRVLKPGGWLWLYLYGSGGIYWYMVDHFRQWMAGVEVSAAIAGLSLLGYGPGKVAEFVDDWHVPVLHRYTHADAGACLAALGLPGARLLTGGMAYDSSARRQHPGEAVWMGEGDLRYWVQKEHHVAAPPATRLPNVADKGSAFEDPPEVTAFHQPLEAVRTAIQQLATAMPGWEAVVPLAAAGRLQHDLRERLSQPPPFDHAGLLAMVKDTQTWLASLTQTEA